MEARGAFYPGTPLREPSLRELSAVPPLDPDRVRTQGYEAATPDAVPPAAAGSRGGENEVLERERHPNEAELLNGPSNGALERVEFMGTYAEQGTSGCLAESLREAYGSLRAGVTATAFRENGALPALNAANASERFVQAQSEWAACMAERGHPGLPNPTSAMARASEAPEKGVETAVADAECRARTRLEGVHLEEINAFMTTLLESHASDVTALQEIKRAARDRVGR